VLLGAQPVWRPERLLAIVEGHASLRASSPARATTASSAGGCGARSAGRGAELAVAVRRR